MLNLRPYQTEALMSVRDAYKAGKRRVIVSLPTGTGKTVVFAYFPRALKMKKRLLVLAHREELLLKAQEKFRSIDPDLKVEIEQAGGRAPPYARGGGSAGSTPGRHDRGRPSRVLSDDVAIVMVA